MKEANLCVEVARKDVDKLIYIYELNFTLSTPADDIFMLSFFEDASTNKQSHKVLEGKPIEDKGMVGEIIVGGDASWYILVKFDEEGLGAAFLFHGVLGCICVYKGDEV